MWQGGTRRDTRRDPDPRSQREGYWNAPEDAEAAIVDGWFPTGDVGHVDPDGYVFIVDRAKTSSTNLLPDV
jgi:acyl-CoA synthetase (AMP-forming)/AMP-acid ligase II